MLTNNISNDDMIRMGINIPKLIDLGTNGKIPTLSGKNITDSLMSTLKLLRDGQINESEALYLAYAMGCFDGKDEVRKKFEMLMFSDGIGFMVSSIRGDKGV